MMVADVKVTDDEGDCPTYFATKITRFLGGIAGACGDAGNCLRFLEWARKDFEQPEPKFIEGKDAKFVGLILNAKGLHIFYPGLPTAEKLVGADAQFYAIGSGGELARLAMHLGKHPVDAVKLACRYDEASGGRIQVLKLKGK